MNTETIYDLELNGNNFQASQSDKILVKLKPHQLTSLYKAIEMENNGAINYKLHDIYHITDTIMTANSEDELYTKVKIGTNIGILGDMVGYGKTLIALSLIATNDVNNIYINPNYIKHYNNHRNYNYLNISVSNTLVQKDDNIINSTLIIVPRGPVYVQWEKTIMANTKLKVLSVSNFNFIKSNLPKYNGTNKREIFNYFEKYDIVLIKNTTFKTLYNNYYAPNILKSWKRIMIDEAHDIMHQIP